MFPKSQECRLWPLFSLKVYNRLLISASLPKFDWNRSTGPINSLFRDSKDYKLSMDGLEDCGSDVMSLFYETGKHVRNYKSYI